MNYPRPLEEFHSEGFRTTAYEDSENGPCRVMADADIDVDGLAFNGHNNGDPDFQPDTTLHYQGKPLNSDVDKWMVLPNPCIEGVSGIVIGCQGTVYYRGRSCPVVVGDKGPTYKIGEISRAVALELGIDPSPTHGGVDDASVRYEWHPGVAALVDGRQYSLQPS